LNTHTHTFTFRSRPHAPAQEEVLAHLRALVGSDALLAAYNTAREAVKARRSDRK